MYSLRHAASFERESVDSSIPSIVKAPEVGRSIPAMRLSSVVFPLPLGPISARNVPASTSRSSRSSGLMTVSPRRYSRVSCLHSMRGMVASFLCDCDVGLADDVNLLTFFQTLRIGDQLIARLKAAR